MSVVDMMRKITLYTFILFLPAFLFTSCEDPDSGYIVAFDGYKDTVEWYETSIYLNIYSDVEWVITGANQTAGERDDWFKIERKQGYADDRIKISFAKNMGDVRSAVITVDLGDDKRTLELTQLDYFNVDDYVLKDWFELPANYTEEESGISLIFHYIPEVREKRNYTVRYDTERHYPQWVAYPMHISYHLGSGRSDAWAYDPKLSSSLQPNMLTSMGNGYDRGHMIPSASRNVTKLDNIQTFYFTNMSCQKNALNAGVWENLESRVRGWSGRGTDTLYVVTGAVLQRVDITDNTNVVITYAGNDTKPISVPNYYYKALVKRYGNGQPPRAIAFWYSKNDGRREVRYDDAISIKELEKRTGLTFFPQLNNDALKAKLAPEEWGLWPTN